jgi:hypothetical protein
MRVVENKTTPPLIVTNVASGFSQNTEDIDPLSFVVSEQRSFFVSATIAA